MKIKPRSNLGAQWWAVGYRNSSSQRFHVRRIVLGREHARREKSKTEIIRMVRVTLIPSGVSV